MASPARRPGHRRLDDAQELVLPVDLLAEVLIRLPSLADLGRASAACASFRRVATDPAFLRRARALHPPSLLGFCASPGGFHPAEPPHPSAPAARAVLRAADFGFSFLPSPLSWVVRDVLDGLFLLDRDGGEGGAALRILAVCDPLFRRYSLLPQIPEDIAASVRRRPRRGVAPNGRFDTFFAPIGEEERAAAAMAETSFKVIWIAQCPDKLVAFVFSSVTGQWRATASPCWGDLSPAFSPPACRSLLRRSYAYGCFYWMIGDSGNLLVLDMCKMDFSVLELPSSPPGRDIVECAIVEAGEGKLGMFAFCNCIDIYALELYSRTMQNEGRVASKWSFESAILMPSRDGFRVLGVTGKELCLQVSPICVSGCYLLEFSTNPSCKKLEFVLRGCSNFSAIPVCRLPAISIITKHMKRQQQYVFASVLDLTDELLEEVFVRLPTAADLARASAACASFRRLITGHAFLRRFRRLHPPPVLGILAAGFLAAQAPHPSAAAADFRFSFVPSRDRWCPRHFSDGRYLLSAIPERSGPAPDHRALVKEFAVCDPLYRRYLLLPPIPDDLASAVNQSEIVNFEPFLCPATEDEEDTMFRVICLAQCEAKLVAFIYSRGSGQWHAVEFDGWRDLTRGTSNPYPSGEPELSGRYYAHGCFCWVMHWVNKLLVLDTRSFEFSSIDLPPGPLLRRMVIVEALEGKLGLFTLCNDNENALYFLRTFKLEWFCGTTYAIISPDMYAGG
uniref:F-box domain-containing protein n=1 Tax=Oryza meridionalis TaxID=40149 RepID=A0A0E0ED02_9ORYZ